MADTGSFNLTATLNVIASSQSIRQSVSQVQTAFRGLNIQVPVSANLGSIQTQISALQGRLQAVTQSSQALSSSLTSAMTSASSQVTALANQYSQLGTNIANLTRQTQQLAAAQAQVQGPAAGSPQAPSPASSFSGSGFGRGGIVQRVRGAERVRHFVDRATAASPNDLAISASGGEGSSSRFAVERGVAGGLSGAAEGFALAGPLGAAVGGLIGFTKSLADAKRDIEQFQINRLSERAGEDFSRANHSISGRGYQDDTELTRATSGLQDAANRQVSLLDAERGLFLKQGPQLAGDRSGEVGAIIRGTQEVVKKHEGEILSGLSIQARKAGLADTGAAPTELTSKLTSDKQNGELVRLLAISRSEGASTIDQFNKNIDVERQKILTDIQQAVAAAQRAGQSEQSKAQADAASVALHLMTDSVHTVSESLLTLKTSSDGLAAIFAGQLHAGNVGLSTTPLGQPGAVDTFGTISRSVGSKAGNPIFDSANSVQTALTTLPDVLSRVAGTKPKSEQEFSNKVEAELQGLPDHVRDAIIAGLNEKLFKTGGIESTTRRSGIDSQGFAQELLRGLSGPLDSFAQKFGSELSAQANRFTAGLSTFQGQQRQIGSSQDVLGDIRLQGLRQKAIFDSESAGRPSEGASSLTLQQLSQPFTERVNRLSNGIGQDPKAIGAELSRVQSRIGQVTDQRQAAHQAFPGGVAFERTSQELANLQRRAIDLQGALKELTSETINAGAREKLAGLKGEEQNRLGLADRLFTASPEDAAHLTRGALLAQQAHAQGGDVSNFGGIDKQDLKSFLDATKNIKLGALGGVTGGDFYQQILKKNLPGIAELNPEDAKQKDTLQAAILEGEKTRAVAQETLIANQRELSANFFTQLAATQNEFFSRLANTLGAQGPAKGLAGGGSIFKERGTDTVPAMLSAGEFVVKADATKKNLGLLQRINSGATIGLSRGGVVYKDDGGDVDGTYSSTPANTYVSPLSNEDRARYAKIPPPAAVPDDKPQYRTAIPGEDTPADLGLRRFGILGGTSAKPVPVIRRPQPRPRPAVQEDDAPDNPIGEANPLHFVKPAGDFVRPAQARFAYGVARQSDIVQARLLRMAQIASRDGRSRPGGAEQASILTSSFSKQLADAGKNAFIKPEQVASQTVPVWPRPLGKAQGGPISGDSIPALLTSGEYVMSRPAVQAIGVGVMNSINARRFATGGIVGDAPSSANGTAAPANGIAFPAEATQAMNAFANAASTSFAPKVDAFVGATSQFGTKVDAFGGFVSKMPNKVEMVGQQRLEVVLNGAEVLTKLQPDLEQLIGDKISAALQKLLRDKLPDLQYGS